MRRRQYGDLDIFTSHGPVCKQHRTQRPSAHIRIPPLCTLDSVRRNYRPGKYQRLITAAQEDLSDQC